MDNTLIACILFFASAVLIALGYSIVIDPSLFYLCPNTFGPSCISQEFREGVGRPLFSATYLLPLLFFVLIFVRKEVFTLWWKIALPFAALGIFLITLSPAMPDVYLPDRAFMTERVMWVFFFISIGVVAYKYVEISTREKRTGIFE